MTRTQHLAIALVSVYAIVSGVGEVVVGVTGNFLSILSKNLSPSSATVLVGMFYILAGLSLLTMKKRGAVLSIVFLGAEVLGRLYLVMTGIAPSKGADALKIAVGGAIALAIILYVRSQWKEFY
jgi:uncharacterized membrane protein